MSGNRWLQSEQIALLSHKDSTVAAQIRALFQVSYAIEAELLGAVDFPPLKRPLNAFIDCDNLFYGLAEDNQLLAAIEVETSDATTHLQSLVVHPSAFRRGLATTMVQFALDKHHADTVTVETGSDNLPARKLYEKLGFQLIHEWDTDHGVRKVRYCRT